VEIQALAPNTNVGAGVSSTMPGGLGPVACGYKWGTGNNAQSGHFWFTVTLSDASKLFPGMSSDLIKQGIRSKVQSERRNASEIPGVGEAAVFTSNDPIRAYATAYTKGLILEITFEGVNARAKRDQVIALLKSAVARL
jgi:hypothetical protein